MPPRLRAPRLLGAAFLLIPLAAFAGEGYVEGGRTAWAWGSTSTAFVELSPGEDHPADVVFTNRLTHGNSIQMDFVLEIDGMRVGVAVVNGVGEAPDVVTVRPPAGFVAEPATIEVDEGEVGRIRILPALLS
ncbi:hypothetical protein [Rubellimicrobium aerolatum]|uniref:Copper chaperone PCu(A)C n=1 Tax=Rubellimicrobium aerolatum TaxID=490979 RepID=A0ABW0SBV6_9RHOB|nr:hypothetical protein [Rubellimicrobium aerolatum]MBP1805867.1 hypothetical protein [Rubellimicrobium aerolatum]